MRGIGRGAGKHTVALSIAGLAAGFALGIAAHSTQNLALAQFAAVIGPLGKLWTNALQVIVIPLVAMLLFSSIASMPNGRTFGKWGWASAAAFISLLTLGAVFAAVGTKAYLAGVAPEASLVRSAGPAGEGARLTFGDWVGGLLPANLFEALAKGELLPVMLVAILLALSARSLKEEPRNRLVEVAQALRDAILGYVHWLMLLLPFGAFALSLSFGAEKGFSAAGVVLHFLVLILTLLVVFTFLLYPLVAILGSVSMGRFASAAIKPQMVALSSRSSVASLPALVEAADHDLKLPQEAGSLVLPLSVSVFKLNRTVSSTGKVLFAAYVLGIAISPANLIAFVLTVMLLSVSTPGIPSTGSNVTLGAYIAAGIPAEVALLFEPVEPILDMFKTVLNVTGNLAVAAIVSRFCGLSSEPELLSALDPVAAAEA